MLGQVSGKGHELDEVIKSLGSYFQKNSLLKRKNKVSLFIYLFLFIFFTCPFSFFVCVFFFFF